jgi:hypothetical protein
LVGKGIPPKRRKVPDFLLLVRQKISAELSQNFVKRYQWPFGIIIIF